MNFAQKISLHRRLRIKTRLWLIYLHRPYHLYLLLTLHAKETERTVYRLQDSLSQEQVRMLISKAAGKSCQLDPIPTPIVLKSLDVLLPVITKLINLSFDTGRFAEAWKEALVLPSLKKPGLDFAFKNFRPVSNLSYISKLSERAGAEQFMEHPKANNLHS